MGVHVLIPPILAAASVFQIPVAILNGYRNTGPKDVAVN